MGWNAMPAGGKMSEMMSFQPETGYGMILTSFVRRDSIGCGIVVSYHIKLQYMCLLNPNILWLSNFDEPQIGRLGHD